MHGPIGRNILQSQLPKTIVPEFSFLSSRHELLFSVRHKLVLGQ